MEGELALEVGLTPAGDNRCCVPVIMGETLESVAVSVSPKPKI